MPSIDGGALGGHGGGMGTTHQKKIQPKRPCRAMCKNMKGNIAPCNTINKSIMPKKGGLKEGVGKRRRKKENNV